MTATHLTPIPGLSSPRLGIEILMTPSGQYVARLRNLVQSEPFARATEAVLWALGNLAQ